MRLLIAFGLALVPVAIALPFLTTGYVVYIANLLLVFTVLSLGMHIVIGEAGQFSLAHAAFYGLGIYTAGLLNNALGLPLLINIVAGGLVAAFTGFAIGFLSLRMRDIYLALSTFAFGEAMQWLFLNWTPVTGGPNGLNFQPASLFGWTILSDKAAYPLVVIITVLFIAATLVIHFSTLGRSFRAVREFEIAAAAVGIDVKRVKLLAFTLLRLLRRRSRRALHDVLDLHPSGEPRLPDHHLGAHHGRRRRHRLGLGRDWRRDRVRPDRRAAAASALLSGGHLRLHPNAVHDVSAARCVLAHSAGAEGARDAQSPYLRSRTSPSASAASPPSIASRWMCSTGPFTR